MKKYEKIPWKHRDMLPMPDEVKELELYANQPGNFKSRKPARFLIMYAQGTTRQAILKELNVSNQSLSRWWTRWVEDGVMGLRYLSG